jgi:serine/threonine protein kinase/tetratricopeptide (TPR) repeat protein
MIGNSLTHYRITTKLGEGGMGEVYRASDTKLGREVAIKVLPASFSRDPQSLGRFEREAKALASLNHPHIAAIHGFDADQGTHFLVLELVEGQTLSERLRRGRLPLDEALRVARQIAEAVEAAHAKGIIHRDLKPGNIKLTPEGRVKVLDFGLAKMEESVRGLGTSASDPDAPTLKAEMTAVGAVMGTPAYMSPEQARGQEVDKRTDVWAFGCCLFECLSGSKPFRGETVTDLMAAVLRSEPDWTVLPAETPREVATLLRRCLEKDPRRRLSSLGDIALVLEETTQIRTVAPSPESKQLKSVGEKKSISARFGLAFGVTGLLIGLVIAGIAMWRQPKSAVRASQIRSLAVLPFKVNSPDPKLAGLEKWIPLEIVSKLGQVTNLQVVNLPTKIELLVSQKKDVDEIARELQVDGLVRTELAGQGDAMTVYVTVVDSTGRAVGKPQNLPASVTKISLIPNQVAEAVVNGLNVQLSASQRAEIQVADTRNGDAFLAFQKGRDFLSSRQFSQAAGELRRAYQLDTNYTRAWTTLAHSEWNPLIYGGTTNEMAVIFKHLSGEAERFGAQRPDDPHVASLRMWMAMLYERDWNKVRTIFWERQRNSRPESALMQVMAWYYTLIEGHPELASNASKQAIALDPENLLWQIDGAHQLHCFGRFDEALSLFRSFPPEKIQLEDYSRVLLAAGDLTGAKEVAAQVLARRPNAGTKCVLAAIHAKSGAADEARRILRELEAQAAQGMHIPFGRIAWSYGMLGDFDAARRWMRQGLLEGRGDLSMLWLRTAGHLEIFGKLTWYWEIVDAMKFPPLQMDHPYFALEQAMRYGRGTDGPTTTGTSANEPPKTLAVLPFDKIGAGAADDDFNEGLTIELITLLQNVKGLRVQGPMSSMQFKGSTNSTRQVGEQLKVDHLLQGKVRRAGDRLRIDVSLQKAADGFGLWATNYDRKLSDIFAIQTEVAQQVAEALKVKLGIEDRRTLARQSTGNAEAYSLYLQGRAAWNRRTIPDFERAIAFFNQALEKDANFALTYAGLADVHAVWPLYSGEPPGPHSAESAKFARLALEKDPLLGGPHAALGFTRSLFQHDWEGAEKEFQAAIRLSSENANAHHWYSEFLCILGRHDESLAEAKRAVELDPTSINLASRAFVTYFAGQRERAIADLLALIDREPHFWMHYYWLYALYAHGGDLEKAAAILERAQRAVFQNDPSKLALLKARVLALQGKSKEARELLAQVGKAPRGNAFRALVLHDLGEDREAMELLENAIREGEWLSGLVYEIPYWSKLHGHPRFRAILKSINLEKYVPIPASTNAP